MIELIFESWTRVYELGHKYFDDIVGAERISSLHGEDARHDDEGVEYGYK